MRRRLLYVLAVVLSAVVSVTSCKIDSEPYYYSYMTAVSDGSLSGEAVSYLVTDDSLRVYPVNWNQALLGLKHNQRIFATFTANEITDPINADFRGVSYISEDSIKTTSNLDVLGTDPITITSAWHSGGIYGAGRYLTVTFVVRGAGYTSHGVTLADNPESSEGGLDSEGYYNLILRHDDNNDSPTMTLSGVLTYPLEDKYVESGIKGLRIHSTPLSASSDSVVTVTY